MTDDGPLAVTIDGSGSGDGIRDLVGDLQTFAESLDDDARYDFAVEIRERFDD